MQRFPSYKKTSKPVSHSTIVIAIAAVLFGLGAVTMSFAHTPMRVSAVRTQAPMTTPPMKTVPVAQEMRQTTSQLVVSDKRPVVEVKKEPVSSKLVVYRSTSDKKMYVSVNGKRYLIVDARVAKTWGLSSAPSSKRDPVKTTGGAVRPKPGSLPINMKGSNTLYIATRGGVLHKISSPDIAVEYWGKDWKRKTYVLPSALVKRYRTGEVVTKENSAMFKPGDMSSVRITDEL